MTALAVPLSNRLVEAQKRVHLEARLGMTLPATVVDHESSRLQILCLALGYE